MNIITIISMLERYRIRIDKDGYAPSPFSVGKSSRIRSLAVRAHRYLRTVKDT